MACNGFESGFAYNHEQERAASEVGTVSESASVSAEAATVQLSNSGKSNTNDSKDLDDLTGGYTGTPDVTQRCQVISDPLSGLQTGRDFNASAFAMPALATGPNNSLVGPPALVNLGGAASVLRYPMVTNFDVTLTKVVPLGSEKRALKFQAQHTAFSTIRNSTPKTPASSSDRPPISSQT